MRALRERPRVVAAQALVALALVGAGVLIGLAVSGDDGSSGVPASTVERLRRAEDAAARDASELKALRARLDRAEARARRANARARRAERRLRRARRRK